MLYPVKIFDPKGKLKKILSKEKVHDLFWDQFNKEAVSPMLNTQQRKLLKEKLNAG